jgi:hypothetical protein
MKDQKNLSFSVVRAGFALQGWLTRIISEGARYQFVKEQLLCLLLFLYEGKREFDSTIKE